MIDLVGHLGYVLVIAGTILVARHQPTGWLVRAAGDVTWTVLGVLLGLTSIWLWEVFFVLCDVTGFITWKRECASSPSIPKPNVSESSQTDRS